MARVRMVTRTVVGTKVTVLALNTETAEPQNITYELGGTYDDNVKLLKAVQKAYDTEVLKNVSVVLAEPFETLYGMEEVEFIKNAKVLPPRTKEDIEEVEQADTKSKKNNK